MTALVAINVIKQVLSNSLLPTYPTTQKMVYIHLTIYLTEIRHCQATLSFHLPSYMTVWLRSHVRSPYSSIRSNKLGRIMGKSKKFSSNKSQKSLSHGKIRPLDKPQLWYLHFHKCYSNIQIIHIQIYIFKRSCDLLIRLD